MNTPDNFGGNNITYSRLDNGDLQDYLNFSNELTRSREVTGTSDGGIADCDDYTRRTFDEFQTLIKSSDREDLASKVRMVGGYFKGGPHVWLEFLKEGEWTIYETTIPRTYLSSKNSNIQNPEDYYSDTASIPGTKIFHPSGEDWFNPFKTGAIHLTYTILKNKELKEISLSPF